MAPELQVRAFSAADAPAVAAIYNQGIAERIATFETEPRSPSTMAEQFGKRADTHPAIVVEQAGEVVAVAWTSEYRPRRAYAGIAETSVYVAKDARGQGLGRLALASVIDAAERKGFWKLVSRIFPENAASRRLCATLGFREVGVYHRHGKLDGVWRDASSSNGCWARRSIHDRTQPAPLSLASWASAPATRPRKRSTSAASHCLPAPWRRVRTASSLVRRGR